MNYILKSLNEGSRLDQQTEIEQFSLKEELKGIEIAPGQRVLDAGCGSGVLCRFLEENYSRAHINGCDLSSTSLEHAKAKSRFKETNYFQHNLITEPLPSKYDVIFNRLVAHHLNKQLPTLYQNLYAGLNDGGQLYVIDTDGLFLNLATLSTALQQKIELVKSAFHGNLNAGRITPALLKQCGFRSVSWRIDVMDFQGTSREKEVQQWRERFESSLHFYVGLFGSEFEARKFFKEYTTEASNSSVPMFYNKFVVKGVK